MDFVATIKSGKKSIQKQFESGSKQVFGLSWFNHLSLKLLNLIMVMADYVGV